MPKPFAESCEQNKAPILDVLRREFTDPGRVLEIGSGTGQHAVWFARHLPHLVWQTADLRDNHPGIHAWLVDGPDNVLPPVDLDACGGNWHGMEDFDAVFSANTIHIMDWPSVECLFAGIGQLLPVGGKFALYGPFNYDGRYTSESNRRFDEWLRERDPASGIRDAEAVDELANRAGLILRNDYEMPANNRTRVWRKSG
ncbi:DUF938 domain-containing protein [Thiohalomonas denitrificans]|uniref:Methylase n=1 Tax=Thiohalomonas denitrificans TaxID=415747 RepID=A0A1G5QX33_9GAMM|nr:DUF938 domain-containing protein [Thiohalomonas denitrificans]SCZ66312.1 Protein of unknown function [Thiohalomonas denitrificans]